MTVASGHGELDGALSQDGGGGIYATYLAGSGGAVDLSYSADGGHSFSTAALNANSDGGADNLSSAVNAAGQGWATWTDNGSVFASSFQAVDAISSAKTSGGATSNGSTVTVNVTCAAFPCTVTIVLTAPETVVVHAASVSHKKHKSKTLTLGKGTITIKTKGGKKLTFKLSGAAHRLLEGKKGHFKVSALISTKIEHHTTKVTKTLTLTSSRRVRSEHADGRRRGGTLKRSWATASGVSAPSLNARSASSSAAPPAPPITTWGRPAPARERASAVSGSWPAAITTVSAATRRSAPSASRITTAPGSIRSYATPVRISTPAIRSSWTTAQRVDGPIVRRPACRGA